MHTPYEKLHLRALHQEIDLFDRKLAHLARYGEYSSEADRKAAASKLEKKRETLAVEARKMVKSGVYFAASDLPRSFREDAPTTAPVPSVEVEPKTGSEKEPATVVLAEPLKGRHESPFAGTSLDGKLMLAEYKRNKVRKEAPVSTVATTDSARSGLTAPPCQPK
ncbi:MAG: hypothetical protein ACP5M4_06335 [Acidobacteriaceae bacterium]